MKKIDIQGPAIELKRRSAAMVNWIFESVGLALVRRLRHEARPDYLDQAYDYVRSSQLELCSGEIYRHRVTGAVAEVGVHRGDFARQINQAFPDRKLHLFDTFAGFPEAEVALERKIRQTAAIHYPRDINTSVELVMSKMSDPAQCLIHQGFFPDTAQDVRGPFAFVSLDTDMYPSIYRGLEFFYPKLSPGGYIFVHDYNNSNYPTVKLAVHDYWQEQRFPYLPQSDNQGSVIILKPYASASDHSV